MISRLIVWIVFDRKEWLPTLVEGRAFAAAVIGITAVSMVSAAMAAFGIARAKPWKLLQSDES